MTATYHVQTSAFEGPFDLLLHLIARRKVDIYDVSLAEITDDYLAVIGALDTLDLEVTTEFLVVAATLIELKAARLLPTEDDPEIDELALETRDLLYARLLDYRRFREAAGHVRRRLSVYDGYIARDVALEPYFAKLRPDAVIGVTPKELARIAARAFIEAPDDVVDFSHVHPARMTVREAAGTILEELTRHDGPITFAELTTSFHHISDIVVHFLACLELYKLDHVDLEQSSSFGTLTVTWTPDGELGDTSFIMDSYEGDSLDVTDRASEDVDVEETREVDA